MIAVAQGRAADAADHGVSRLDAGVAPVRQAGALGVVAQFAHQRVVDVLSLVGGRPRIRVLDAGAGLLEHVAHAGAGPRAHTEKDIVHKAKRIEPQHGRIDPAIDRDIGRTEHGRFADGLGAAGIAARRPGAARFLGGEWIGGHQEKSCQHRYTLDNRRDGQTSAHVHTHTLSSGCPGWRGYFSANSMAASSSSLKAAATSAL